jgi:hypothetical protein
MGPRSLPSTVKVCGAEALVERRGPETALMTGGV